VGGGSPSEYSAGSPAHAGRGAVLSQIPVYSAAGRRIDYASERELAQLEARGLLARIVRRRDGSPARAYLRPRDGLESPGRLSAYMGQRYSYIQHLQCGQTWVLRRLGRGDELRPIFLQVLTECLVIH